MMKNLHEYGQRAVATKHWRWMRGMSTLCGAVVLEDNKNYVFAYGYPSRSKIVEGGTTAFLPDFNDKATLGCLLALVQEVYDGKIIFTLGPDDGVVVVNGDRRTSSYMFTGALVAALEVAP